MANSASSFALQTLMRLVPLGALRIATYATEQKEQQASPISDSQFVLWLACAAARLCLAPAAPRPRVARTYDLKETSRCVPSIYRTVGLAPQRVWYQVLPPGRGNESDGEGRSTVVRKKSCETYKLYVPKPHSHTKFLGKTCVPWHPTVTPTTYYRRSLRDPSATRQSAGLASWRRVRCC